MLTPFLTAKIHRATVTRSDLNYEGSCAIDEDLLAASGIRPFQAIDIYNVTNGERFSTYAIAAEAGSGIISVNGAAARKASAGDLVIIAAYAHLSEDEAQKHKPRLVYPDAANRIERQGASIPLQKD